MWLTRPANDDLSHQDCVDQLAELDITTGDNLYFDGYSQGCRALHAVFAESNTHHCAHISFAPIQDADGKVKCQESSNIQVTELFTSDELLYIDEYCLQQAELDFSPDCFVLVDDEEPNDEPTTRRLRRGRRRA